MSFLEQSGWLISTFANLQNKMFFNQYCLCGWGGNTPFKKCMGTFLGTFLGQYAKG